MGFNVSIRDDEEDDKHSWNEEDFSNDDHEASKRLKNKPYCPYDQISKEERMSLCKTWKKAIIIKLLGKRIGYRLLLNKL